MHTGPSEVSCQSLCDSPETTQSMPPGTFEVSLNNKKKKKKEKKKSNKPSGYTDVRFYESNAKGDGSLLFFFFSGIRFYD